MATGRISSAAVGGTGDGREHGRGREGGRAGDRGGGGRPGAAGGFTLIEILIAMVILMVGLLGILAVFPTALRSANRAVEDTYSASIAQSVVDALELGVRAMHARFEDGLSFLIFDHDGVPDIDADRPHLQTLDLGVRSNADAILSKDYCVVLPKKDEVDARGRGRAYLYPRPTPGGNPRPALEFVQTPQGDAPKVLRVFKLGGMLGKDPNASVATQAIERRDPYPQYGFAFTIRPARGPDAAASGGAPSLQPIAGLYEVVVYIYRNFDPNPRSRYYQPVREFVTNIAE